MLNKHAPNEYVTSRNLNMSHQVVCRGFQPIPGNHPGNRTLLPTSMDRKSNTLPMRNVREERTRELSLYANTHDTPQGVDPQGSCTSKVRKPSLAQACVRRQPRGGNGTDTHVHEAGLLLRKGPQTHA